MQRMKLLLLAVFFAVFPLSAAISASPSCEPPVAVADFLKGGIAVLVCESGTITVEDELVAEDDLFSAIEIQMNGRPGTPLRVAFHMLGETEFREELMTFAADGPPGSGTILFAGDFWVGGLNSSIQQNDSG